MSSFTTARIDELLAENQRLREANRRLQATGPALERDKLIIELRVRIQTLDATLCLYRALYALSREVLPVNPLRYEIMTEPILEAIERIEKEYQGINGEKVKSNSGDREGRKKPRGE